MGAAWRARPVSGWSTGPDDRRRVRGGHQLLLPVGRHALAALRRLPSGPGGAARIPPEHPRPGRGGGGELPDPARVLHRAFHRSARRDLLPHATRRNPTRVYNFNSTQGFVSPARLKALGLGLEYWHPAITDHYRFALSRSGIDGILCALNGPRQVETLALALDQGALNDEEERYLMDLARLDQGRARLMNGVRGV